ncbi:hypothetical protein ARMGADRAFT_357199 [Armillaria gallica]|uniref:Uncharacterized protein n=1 Tax=Armillaria gallica TaxID=47427 RepID=A0A2H3DH99_ARMGA|nr:hypothetical protein ARMGADRAFT_357199 [Armillaria gallica]
MHTFDAPSVRNTPKLKAFLCSSLLCLAHHLEKIHPLWNRGSVRRVVDFSGTECGIKKGTPLVPEPCDMKFLIVVASPMVAPLVSTETSLMRAIVPKYLDYLDGSESG